MLPPDLPPTGDLTRVFAWRRVRFAVIWAFVFAVLLNLTSAVTPLWVWYGRTLFVAAMAVLAFGGFEQWPARLRPGLARWVLQLMGVFVAVPVASFLSYRISTGTAYFWQDSHRLTGFAMLTVLGMLFAPWAAFGAMVRQREARVVEQALAFQLERSELERQAIDARLRLLQAQVQPHFLFNTLANVRALVRTGSPQAGAVLDSLVAYLRASVPHLDEPGTTLGRELVLVRAYLELMHLRMPDRLQYTIHAEPGLEHARCPPMTLHTLVENAVRHGIDPSEVGGRIEISAFLQGGRCHLRVVDTGVGLGGGAATAEAGPGVRADGAPGGLGTGLATLRERLALAFAGDARLAVSGLMPHGTCAEVEFPVQAAGGVA